MGDSIGLSTEKSSSNEPGNRITVDNEEVDIRLVEICPICKTKEEENLLRFFHLSPQLAVLKCSGSECMYPFENFLYKDSVNDITFKFDIPKPIVVASEPSTNNNDDLVKHETKTDSDVPSLLDLTEANFDGESFEVEFARCILKSEPGLDNFETILGFDNVEGENLNGQSIHHDILPIDTLNIKEESNHANLLTDLDRLIENGVEEVDCDLSFLDNLMDHNIISHSPESKLKPPISELKSPPVVVKTPKRLESSLKLLEKYKNLLDPSSKNANVKKERFIGKNTDTKSKNIPTTVVAKRNDKANKVKIESNNKKENSLGITKLENVNQGPRRVSLNNLRRFITKKENNTSLTIQESNSDQCVSEKDEITQSTVKPKRSNNTTLEKEGITQCTVKPKKRASKSTASTTAPTKIGLDQSNHRYGARSSSSKT